METGAISTASPARHSAFRRISFFGWERPAKCGLFSSPIVSGDRCSNFLGREYPKVSRRIQENSRFLETCLGDRRIIPLRARGRQYASVSAAQRRRKIRRRCDADAKVCSYKADLERVSLSNAVGGLDEWLRRRMRAIAWKQWKTGPARFAELRRCGVGRDLAAKTAGSPHGPSRLVSPALHIAMQISFFRSLGLRSLVSPATA